MKSCNVSFYRNASDNIGTSADLFTILKAIKSGRWHQQVELVRNTQNESEKLAAKKALPAFTASGLFAKRCAQGLKSHSGYLCIDIDYKDNTHLELQTFEAIVRMFKNLTCVAAVSRSAGGKGFFVIFRIEPTAHAAAFEFIKLALHVHLQIVIDNACKDVSRLRFVSYDPSAYINECADVFNNDFVAPASPASRPVTNKPRYNYDFTPNKQYSDVLYIAESAKNLGHSLLESYTEWYAAGQSLADVFGESGRELFHLLSCTSAKYTVAATDKQFDYCLKRKKNSTLNIIYSLAKRANIYVKYNPEPTDRQPLPDLPDLPLPEHLPEQLPEPEPEPTDRPETVSLADVVNSLGLQVISSNKISAAANVVLDMIYKWHGSISKKQAAIELPVRLKQKGLQVSANDAILEAIKSGFVHETNQFLTTSEPPF
jgi:hypothetical protein